ncbi:MAG TPA: DUF2089 domain-containing protein [Dehalococcoidia bacterium]
MHPLIGRCPVCGEAMTVVRLECRTCGSALEGEFGPGPLARLSQEQARFVEVFLKARGKIKDVEEELGISYPTVVSRLNEVIATLGYEVRGEEPPESDAEDLAERRRAILDELASGAISAAEAARRLREL